MTHGHEPIDFRGTERFTLVALLGRGGSGAVYEARDRERGGHVALKVLGERSAWAISHFKNEFRSLQELKHPNLVELKELIFEGGHWLLSMELVRGTDILSHVWRKTGAPRVAPPRPPLIASSDDDTLRDGDARPIRREGEPAPESFCETRVRRAFTELARGLGALHAAGKIHRDVKRSNVLVDADERVVVLDFGLVAELGADGAVALSERAGTAVTMAPEQASAGKVGPAADWYAFGAVLYEALAGRAPFAGSRQEILEQKRCSRPPRADWLARAPSDLRELCLALLAHDAALRPTGPEVLARLAGARPSEVWSGASSTSAQPAFVGRERELAVLDAALERAQAGGSVTIVVEGESGLGKTSLAREFLSRVRRRERAPLVFSGRCFERESLPYKAMDGVVDTVREYLRALPPGAAGAVLPRDLAEIARIFPVLHELVPPLALEAPARAVDPHAQRQRAFRAMRELFVRLAADRGCVVVMDDVHWADVDSVAMLATVLAPPTPRVLWLCLRRPSSPGALAALPGSVTTVALGPLTADESSALMANLLGARARDLDRHVLVESVREGSGHPLFLRELARELTHSGAAAPPAGLGAAL
ncbi:MAG TPA: protein kinase, partial [Polyangiaceae bacterium]|nr:protein kinase [Polyangiaceae bacterium]